LNGVAAEGDCLGHDGLPFLLLGRAV